MKTILCYGDSNLRGTIPGPPLDDAGFVKARYARDKRWTGALQQRLGTRYHIIEEGIGGRTTTLDDIIRHRPYRNGLKDLPFCLETHYPIDLVIFLLGTNDLQFAYQRSVEQVGEGMRQLVQVVKLSNKGPNMQAPQILIICPQPILKIPHLDPQFAKGAVEKSHKLAEIYSQLSHKEGCALLDAACFIQSSEIDGIHLDEHSCQALGHAVSQKVQEICPVN